MIDPRALAFAESQALAWHQQAITIDKNDLIKDVSKLINQVRNAALEEAAQAVGTRLGTYVDIKTAQGLIQDLKR